MKNGILFILLFFGYFITAYAADKIPAGSTAANPMHVKDDQGLLKLADELTTLKDTLKKTQAIDKDLTGLLKIKGVSIGDLYNNDLKEVWSWTAEDWQTTLQGMAGGNNQRYQQLLNTYKSQYPAISKDMLLNKYHVLSNQATTYDNAVRTNAAVISETSYQYNDINKHMQEIQELSADINRATTDKEATDLNSKLLAQLAYIQLAALRMQTLNNQQIGEQRAALLAAQKNHIEFTSHEITQ